MPPRNKSGPGQCPRCDNIYADLLEHITKRHQHDRFQQDEVAEAGLVVCICGRVVRNLAGLMKHQSRYGCLGTKDRKHIARPTTLPVQTDLTSTLTSLSSRPELLPQLQAGSTYRSSVPSAESSALTTLTPSTAATRDQPSQYRSDPSDTLISAPRQDQAIGQREYSSSLTTITPSLASTSRSLATTTSSNPLAVGDVTPASQALNSLGRHLISNAGNVDSLGGLTITSPRVRGRVQAMLADSRESSPEVSRWGYA